MGGKSKQPEGAEGGGGGAEEVEVEVEGNIIPQSTPSKNANSSSKSKSCQICHKQPLKYRCPKCLIRYCGQECFQAHKSLEGGGGKGGKVVNWKELPCLDASNFAIHPNPAAPTASTENLAINEHEVDLGGSDEEEEEEVEEEEDEEEIGGEDEEGGEGALVAFEGGDLDEGEEDDHEVDDNEEDEEEEEVEVEGEIVTEETRNILREAKKAKKALKAARKVLREKGKGVPSPQKLKRKATPAPAPSSSSSTATSGNVNSSSDLPTPVVASATKKVKVTHPTFPVSSQPMRKVQATNPPPTATAAVAASSSTSTSPYHKLLESQELVNMIKGDRVLQSYIRSLVAKGDWPYDYLALLKEKESFKKAADLILKIMKVEGMNE